MKGRVLLIEHLRGRWIAALIEDGRLSNLLIDPPEDDNAPRVGQVLAARVERTVPHLGAAFAGMQGGCTGFIKNAKGLRTGDKIRVQVSGCAEPGKAVPVSPRLLFKGRRLILTPGAPGINVSRKIRDPDERARLAAIPPAATLPNADSVGWILRTAAAGAPSAEIAAEAAALTARAANSADTDTARDIALREWTEIPPEAIFAPSPAAARALREVIDANWPDADLRAAVAAFDGPDMLDHFGVWAQISALRVPRAELPGGAWMSVDPTRALVAIDVNTGDEFGKGAALGANLAAAAELPRQLRLRGLGGIITIDFAPVSRRDRKLVEDALRRAFRCDPVPTELAGWTPLGHFEAQRKRERRPLIETTEGL